MAVWAFGCQKRRRYKALLSAGPLNDEDRGFLNDHFDLWRKMPEDLRQRAEPIIQVLIAEKNFEACGDLKNVTREMQVVIMAQA
ncbi:MAG: zinc-dependent peptidase, partial [Akkermansiaceae bacterium]